MTTNGYKILRGVVAAALIIAAVLLVFVIVSGRQGVTVRFFNVGQGDASLISLPGSTQILIDGGPDTAILSKLGSSMPFFDRTIEYVILSHPHSDHFAGLIPVLERYKVGTFMYNGVERDIASFQRLMNLLKQKDITTQIIENSRVLSLSDDAELLFLYPDHRLSESESEDINAGSLVALFQVGSVRFLFTGDMPIAVEDYLLAKGTDVSADVLKVGHQGSKTSTGEAFLEAVDPRYAVIMVGKNDFGHPHLRVLKRLERASVPVLRTDEAGDIIFVTDGETLTVKK